jgi:DNA-binding HxlR family transcriptional regulator/DNA-binding response OmpR family regulator
MTAFGSDDTNTPEHLLESAALLSKKWHPVIVQTLREEDGLGFSDIETRLGDVSAKVLTDALEELQETEVIDRKEVSTSPLRVEYSLTEQGRELATIVQSLADWGETHLAEDVEEQVVLVADDDRRVAAMHQSWLAESYDVRAAHDGEEALRELDTEVDVLVLDRRMPGLSGDEVLDWLRSQRYDCRVVMITSEDPEVEVLEMGFDEYLTKPVLKDELREVVADLIQRATYDRETRQLLALRSKLAVLEAEYSPSELDSNDTYARVQSRLEELEATVDLGEAVEQATLSRITPEVVDEY